MVRRAVPPSPNLPHRLTRPESGLSQATAASDSDEPSVLPTFGLQLLRVRALAAAPPAQLAVGVAAHEVYVGAAPQAHRLGEGQGRGGGEGGSQCVGDPPERHRLDRSAAHRLLVRRGATLRKEPLRVPHLRSYRDRGEVGGRSMSGRGGEIAGRSWGGRG